MVNEVEILKRKEERVPKNTQYANNWHLNVWKEWGEWRNKHSSNRNVRKKYQVVPDIEENIPSNEELFFWLARFVLEIARKDGKPYPPNTICNICCGIQRHLRRFKCDLEFFNEKDVNFNRFYSSLDSRMKELTGKGIGLQHKRADPISIDDETILWNTGVVGLDTAEGLLNGVFLYGCKTFGLRSFDEHHTLTADQFVVTYDHQMQREKLTFYGKICKTNQGGIKMKSVTPKVVEQYHDPTNPRCVVTLFKRYLSVIPHQGSFYKRAIKWSFNNPTPLFSLQNVGINTLKVMMKKMFENAGIPLEGRNITNHSGKVTLCTTSYNANFDDKAVKARSGHRSDAAQSYKRPLLPMKEAVSNALLPPKKAAFARKTETKVLATSSTAISAMISPIEEENALEAFFTKYYRWAKNCGSKSIIVEADGSLRISVE